MARYLNPLVQDNGPAYIQANCNSVIAVLAYTAGDSYATVTNSANIVAQAACTSGDFTFADGSAGSRILNNAAKTDSSANNAGNPSHIVFLDTVNSRILRVTEETGSLVVSAGSAVTIPNVPLVTAQPVAA